MSRLEKGDTIEWCDSCGRNRHFIGEEIPRYEEHSEWDSACWLCRYIYEKTLWGIGAEWFNEKEKREFALDEAIAKRLEEKRHEISGVKDVEKIEREVRGQYA